MYHVDSGKLCSLRPPITPASMREEAWFRFCGDVSAHLHKYLKKEKSRHMGAIFAYIFVLRGFVPKYNVSGAKNSDQRVLGADDGITIGAQSVNFFRHGAFRV